MEMMATRQTIPESQPLQEMNQRPEQIPSDERDHTVHNPSS